MRAPLIVLGLSSVVMAVVAPSCKTATAIRETFTTDFGCRADGSLASPVMFSLERSGTAPVFDGSPGDATSCTPGLDAMLGDLLLRPNPDYDGTYDLLAVVSARGGDPKAACNLDASGRPKNGLLGGRDCVVARRRVRFEEGREIEQRVFLGSSCSGVVCDPDSSCNPETRLCTVLAVNSPSANGGAEGTPESEGGLLPDLDASAPDAPLEPVTDCAEVPVGACGPLQSPVELDLAEPLGIVAASQQVAWRSTKGGIATVTETDTTSTTRTAYTSFPLDPSYLPVYLGFYTSAAGLERVNVYRGTTSPDVLVRHPPGMVNVQLPPFNVTILRVEAFVSDGQLAGGVALAQSGRFLPFVIDPSSGQAIGTAIFGAGSRPVVDRAFTTGQKVVLFGEGANVLEMSSSGATTTRTNVLPDFRGPSRLLANVGAGAYLVAIGSAPDASVVLTQALASGPSQRTVIGGGVFDTATDEKHVYVLRRPTGSPDVTELLAYVRATGRVCRVRVPDTLAALAVDGTCLYGAGRALAGGSPIYGLRRYPKAAP